jgi:zinc transporter
VISEPSPWGGSGLWSALGSAIETSWAQNSLGSLRNAAISKGEVALRVPNGDRGAATKEDAEMDAVAESSAPAARAAPNDTIDGLAWGYRFSKTGVAEPVQGPALREALEKQEVWLWLNFDLADERASATIAALPHLPTGALAMLRSADDRQQIDGFGQVIAGVVTDYERCDPPDEKRIVRWNFAMTPYVLISAQRRPSHALNQVRSDLQSGRRLPDVLGLFHALIHELASAISLVLNELGAKLNEMEERLLDQKEVGSDALGQARRRLVRVRRQALPLRAVLIHMVNERPYWFDDDAVADCRGVAARMDGLADDLESLQERARTLQDELKAREVEKTNKRLTVLSIVSALLLPPTFITGIFGMNVTGLPFQETAYGLWVACGLMAASMAGMLIVLRRARLI